MEQNIDELKNQLQVFDAFCSSLTEILSEASSESRMRRICEQIKLVTGAEDIALFIRKTDLGVYGYHIGVGKEESGFGKGVLKAQDEQLWPLSESPVWTASLGNDKVLVSKEIPRWQESYSLIYPVTLSKKIIGLVVCLDENPFDIKDSAVRSGLAMLVAHFGPMIEQFEETRDLKEKEKSLRLLYEIGSRLSSIREEDKLLDSILELVEKHVQVDRCSLMIIDKDGKHLRIRRAFGMPEIDIESVKVVVGEGIAGYVATGTKPLLIKDISAERHLISQIEKGDKFRTNSLLSVPLVAQGKPIGVINVNNRKDGMPFSEEDMDLLAKIGSEIASVLQRSYMALQLKKAKELEADIKHSMA